MSSRPRESRRGHQTQETSIVKVDELYGKGGRSPAPGRDLGGGRGEVLEKASGRCWVLLGELAGVCFDMLIGTPPFLLGFLRPKGELQL